MLRELPPYRTVTRTPVVLYEYEYNPSTVSNRRSPASNRQVGKSASPESPLLEILLFCVKHLGKKGHNEGKTVPPKRVIHSLPVRRPGQRGPSAPSAPIRTPRAARPAYSAFPRPVIGMTRLNRHHTIHGQYCTVSPYTVSNSTSNKRTE